MMKTFTHSKNNKFIWVTIMDLQEKHYLCETNQAFCNICDKILCLSMSCAWLRKFQKRLKKAVQDHKRKLLNVNILHFLFDFVQLSEYDLYLLKWIAADIQWCMPDASKGLFLPFFPLFGVRQWEKSLNRRFFAKKQVNFWGSYLLSRKLLIVNSYLIVHRQRLPILSILSLHTFW